MLINSLFKTLFKTSVTLLLVFAIACGNETEQTSDNSTLKTEVSKSNGSEKASLDEEKLAEYLKNMDPKKLANLAYALDNPKKCKKMADEMNLWADIMKGVGITALGIELATVVVFRKKIFKAIKNNPTAKKEYLVNGGVLSALSVSSIALGIHDKKTAKELCSLKEYRKALAASRIKAQ